MISLPAGTWTGAAGGTNASSLATVITWSGMGGRPV